LVFSGPIYKEMKIEGNSIRLFFNYAEGGLVAKGSELTDFTIAGADKKFVQAKAIIDGESIIVSSPQVEKPVAVRFAWSNWAQPNLFNMAILPASSFRTDDWPL
jgi:sialate O-acetylesterase